MRYFVQFAIPVLIFIGVVYAVTRFRRQPHGEDHDGHGIVLVIVVIGAVASVAVLYAIQVGATPG